MQCHPEGREAPWKASAFLKQEPLDPLGEGLTLCPRSSVYCTVHDEDAVRRRVAGGAADVEARSPIPHQGVDGGSPAPETCLNIATLQGSPTAYSLCGSARLCVRSTVPFGSSTSFRYKYWTSTCCAWPSPTSSRCGRCHGLVESLLVPIVTCIAHLLRPVFHCVTSYVIVSAELNVEVGIESMTRSVFCC